MAARVSGSAFCCNYTKVQGIAHNLWSPWPDLVRPPTSSNMARRTVGKAWMAGPSPRLCDSAFTAAGSRCRRSPTQPELPVARRVPATHVLEEGYVDRREGVDDRDEPGQGDLELFLGLSKQPTPLNRTAVGRARPRGSWVASSALRTTRCAQPGSRGISARARADLRQRFIRP